MSRPRTRTSLGHRAQQAGLLVATANLPTTFQRTLMRRSTTDQALVTGLSFAANQAVATLLQDTLQALALVAVRQTRRADPDVTRWSRSSLAVDAVAFAAGIGLQRAFRSRHREPLPRAALRTGGFWLSAAGGSGALIGALQEVLGRRERAIGVPAVVPAAAALTTLAAWRNQRAEQGDGHDEDSSVQGAKALALGLVVSGVAVGFSSAEAAAARRIARLLDRVLPGSEAVWLPVGHLVTSGALAGLGRVAILKVFAGIESKEIAVEAAFDVPPLRTEQSGSLGSHVPFDTLAKQGRRFVWSATHPRAIAEVMGEDAVRHPVRVYVGLASAPTEAARVELAMAELERTGAFDRSHLMVASPTGTGYVNYEAVATLELLTRGDCATVAMQYAARPSVLSLDRVAEGRHHVRLLLEAIRARLADVPPEQRPTVVLFGESLGAWTSQDAVMDRGTQGLVDLGVDRAVWIGTPHFSRWKEQVLHDDRPDVDRSLVGVFDDIDEWGARPQAERAGIRYVMVTHDNDGVALFGPELLFQAPPWLGDPAARQRRVPRAMRWFPNTTFFQVFVDMKNSTNVVPGVLAATGHDYRADLLPFFHAVLGVDANDDQLAAITRWLEADELGRSDWTKRHARPGESMAAAVVRSWMEEHPDDAEQVLGPRLRAIAGRTESDG